MIGARFTKSLTRGVRSLQAAGGRRLAITGVLLVAAMLLARFSWQLPVTDQAENRLFDLRSHELAEPVPQDKRIALVVYTDRTLMDLQKRSPLDRGLLADALRILDDMGAKAIGI